MRSDYFSYPAIFPSISQNSILSIHGANLSKTNNPWLITNLPLITKLIIIYVILFIQF